MLKSAGSRLDQVRGRATPGNRVDWLLAIPLVRPGSAERRERWSGDATRIVGEQSAPTRGSVTRWIAPERRTIQRSDDVGCLIPAAREHCANDDAGRQRRRSCCVMLDADQRLIPRTEYASRDQRKREPCSPVQN